MKIKDDLLKLKTDKELTLNLDDKMKVLKDSLNEPPDDILVKN